MADLEKFTVCINRETDEEIEEMMEFSIRKEATLSEIIDAVIKAMFKERGDNVPPAMKEMIAPAKTEEPKDPLPTSVLW